MSRFLNWDAYFKKKKEQTHIKCRLLASTIHKKTSTLVGCLHILRMLRGQKKKMSNLEGSKLLGAPNMFFFFFNYKLWGASVASKIRTQSFAVNEREVNLLVPNCHLGLTIDEWPGNRPLVYGWTGGGPRLQGKFAHHFRRIYVIYLKFV